MDSRSSMSGSNKIVLVGGAFDLFHHSHLLFLKWAKSLGDYLIVHLSTDERIQFKKGKGRPIYSLKYRKAILEAIKYVDKINIVSDLSPEYNPICLTLKREKPNIYLRHKSVNPEDLEAEEKICEEQGITMIVYSQLPGEEEKITSSSIIEKIKNG